MLCLFERYMTELRKISSQINVEVFAKHEPLHVVEEANYVHSYTITITNNSNEIVQLERRHWFITDGLEYEREVEGEGVVGERPILEPGQFYTYQSWVPLINEYGIMSGYYQFTALSNGDTFEVAIDPFMLQPVYQLN